MEESGRSISGLVLRERNDGWLVARSPGFDEPMLLHYDGSGWWVVDTLPCSIGTTRVFYSDRYPFSLCFADELSAVYSRTAPVRPGLGTPRLNVLPTTSSR